MEKKRNSTYEKVDMAIIKAYMDLCCYKSLAEMTVTEICHKAKINHTTFYRHFKSQWEVRDKIIKNMYADIDKAYSFYTVGEYRGNTEKLFEDLNKTLMRNKELYVVFFKVASIHSFISDVSKYLADKIMADTECENEVNFRRRKLTIIHIIMAVLNLYRCWICGEIDCTEQELREDIVSSIRARRMYLLMQEAAN